MQGWCWQPKRRTGQMEVLVSVAPIRAEQSNPRPLLCDGKDVQ
jgi:hypothetical protein